MPIRYVRGGHARSHAIKPNHVPEGTHAEFIEHFPTVCVEVVLQHDGGVFVAKRANEPVRGEWFWPGSRLYKDEELEVAAHRVAREELGVEIELVEQLRVHAHFWDTSDVVGHPSRHTVNVVYRATPTEADPTIELDVQHTVYRWLTEVDPDLHEYVRLYIDEHGLSTYGRVSLIEPRSPGLPTPPEWPDAR